MRVHSSASIPAARPPLSQEDRLAVRDRYDWTLVSLEHEHPSIDPDSSEYDEDLMFEVHRRLKLLVANGLAPATALELAASQVLRPFGPH